MTNQQHPITPPPDLVEQWHSNSPLDRGLTVATQAAQWGADQELLACGNYLKQHTAWEEEDIVEFYNYRRPKPPSLKEQALEMLDRVPIHDCDGRWYGLDLSLIRCALEQLND
jgi:hypothetical protein